MVVSIKKYCHIIVGLNTGGAERMLVRLLSNNTSGQSHTVISIKYGGKQADELRKLGIDVHVVGVNPWQLLRITKRFAPDAFIGWMYYGNLVAAFCGWLFSKPVIWNIRHSVADIRIEKIMLRLAIRAGALLSNFPKKIIYNSRAAASQHAALGYQVKCTETLPNGVDILNFSPSKSARGDFRQELGLSLDGLVVGHLARFHRMKDHIGFLRAARHIHDCLPSVRFVLVGRGVDSKNSDLTEEIDRLGMAEQVSLLSERDDIAKFLNGLDLLVLSSAWGEAFPNVLIEAMSCKVPVVTTDVGDAASIVADPARVVPIKNPAALAHAVLRFLTLNKNERVAVGEIDRNRVLELYDINRINIEYQSIWNTVT
jgi:glycosyltransferase involved in cell wall biosynthesis